MNLDREVIIKAVRWTPAANINELRRRCIHQLGESQWSAFMWDWAAPDRLQKVLALLRKQGLIDWDNPTGRARENIRCAPGARRYLQACDAAECESALIAPCPQRVIHRWSPHIPDSGQADRLRASI